MSEKTAHYLTQDDAAQLLHLSTRTLERLRHEGTGPEFMKAGRRVLYSRSGIDAWLRSRTFSSAAEAKTAGVR